MTQYQAYKVIIKEIESLNKAIDLKIIKFLPFSEESKRHKMLLARLKHATPSHTWRIKRSLRMITSFIL